MRLISIKYFNRLTALVEKLKAKFSVSFHFVRGHYCVATVNAVKTVLLSDAEQKYFLSLCRSFASIEKVI
jgi:hypothetical protein